MDHSAHAGALTGPAARGASVNRGTLIINGGSFDASSGTALEYMRGTVQLYGGSF